MYKSDRGDSTISTAVAISVQPTWVRQEAIRTGRGPHTSFSHVYTHHKVTPPLTSVSVHVDQSMYVCTLKVGSHEGSKIYIELFSNNSSEY